MPRLYFMFDRVTPKSLKKDFQNFFDKLEEDAEEAVEVKTFDSGSLAHMVLVFFEKEMQNKTKMYAIQVNRQQIIADAQQAIKQIALTRAKKEERVNVVEDEIWWSKCCEAAKQELGLNKNATAPKTEAEEAAIALVSALFETTRQPKPSASPSAKNT